MTYLQILNLIRDTALAQPNVNTVVREFVDLNREDTVYSAVVIQDRDGEYDRIVENGYHTYTWHLGYVDRLTYDESNRDDIFSTGINIINNIVNSIRNTYFPTLEIDLVDKFNTFNQRFTASCAGVYVVLSVNVQVSDCTDPAEDDMYGKFETKITENGEYHFVPDGRPVDEINITVDVPEYTKEEVELYESIAFSEYDYTMTFIPPEGKVYNKVNIEYYPGVGHFQVDTITSNGNYYRETMPGSGGVDFYTGMSLDIDVHPSTSLSKTYYTNGTKTLTGEWKDATIKINVHPSSSLVQTITSNGTKTFTGEWKNASITTDVHPSSSLAVSYSSNGEYNLSGEWKDATISVSVPTKTEVSLNESITSNGSYTFTPQQDTVYGSVSIDVDVHPSTSLSANYTENGTYAISGDFSGGQVTVSVVPSDNLNLNITENGYRYEVGPWADADIYVDVHPSTSLVETITSNGTTSFSGEWKNASISVDVHPSQKLVQTITVNGLTSLSGEWKDADITVSIPDGSFPEPDSDEIYYITYTGNVLDVFDPSDFDANFVSNTYDSTRGFCVLKFDGPITKVGDNAFNNKPQLKKMRLPDSVTRIGAQSFKDSGIIEIQMDGVTRIDYSAFFNSYAQVTPLTIPEGCETITSNAYAYCTAAAIIEIPSTVNFIGHTAFRYCSNLEMVYMYATVPPTLEDDNGTYDQFFDTDGNMTIIVPSGTLSTYQNATGWSTYASRIVEMQ